MFSGPDPCEIGPVDLSGLESALLLSPLANVNTWETGDGKQIEGDEGGDLDGGPRMVCLGSEAKVSDSVLILK
jgi:hypothetical protein